jgi:membrane-associated phospholipid phosphatase
MTTQDDAVAASDSTTARTRSAFLTPRRDSAAIWVVGVGSVGIVVLFGLLVARTAVFTAAELHLSTALNSGHTGALGAITSAVYSLFSPVPAIIMTALIAAVILLRSRSLRLAVTFGVVIALTWIPSALVKAVIHRSRPDAAALPHPFAVQPSDASYPSGHMVFVTALVVTLILLTRGHRIRPLVVALGIALMVIVGVALVIDGVHYSSDVAASALWSIGVAPMVLQAWNRLILPRTYRARSLS